MEVVRLYFGSLYESNLGPACPFNGYAIKHERGVVLVDTGFGPIWGPGPTGFLETPDVKYPWLRRTTIEALADHNIDADDVKYIINTHLGDHSGDNVLLPNATAIIQAPEAEKARETQTALVRDCWDFRGAKIELLNGEDVEVLPGIHAIFTPGHTVGHQSILVDDEDGKQLFVGDAVYTLEIWDHPEVMTEESMVWTAQGANEAWWPSADKLKALDADVIHFAHDSKISRPKD